MDKVFLLHHEYARNGEPEHKITVYGTLAKVKEEYIKLVKSLEKSYICDYNGPALTIHKSIDMLSYHAYSEGNYNEFHDYVYVEQKNVL